MRHNYADKFAGVVFSVQATEDTRIDLELWFLAENGALFEVIAPENAAGNTIGFSNIPTFSYPTLRGYYFKGALTAMTLEYLRKQVAKEYTGDHR